MENTNTPLQAELSESNPFKRLVRHYNDEQCDLIYVGDKQALFVFSGWDQFTMYVIGNTYSNEDILTAVKSGTDAINKIALFDGGIDFNRELNPYAAKLIKELLNQIAKD